LNIPVDFEHNDLVSPNIKNCTHIWWVTKWKFDYTVCPKCSTKLNRFVNTNYLNFGNGQLYILSLKNCELTQGKQKTTHRKSMYLTAIFLTQKSGKWILNRLTIRQINWTT
jgi:hypothetical protein